MDSDKGAEDPRLAITHRRGHLALGHTEDSYAIWDTRQSSWSEPQERFPRDDEGWKRAWGRFNELTAGPAGPAPWLLPLGVIVLVVWMVIFGSVSLFSLIGIDKCTYDVDPPGCERAFRTGWFVMLAAQLGVVVGTIVAFASRKPVLGFVFGFAGPVLVLVLFGAAVG